MTVIVFLAMNSEHHQYREQAAKGLIKKGSTIRFSRTFTEEDVVAFGQLTRDFNPIHYNQRWCQQKGYRGMICHGLLVGSMLCDPGGQWGWLATGMSFRFLKPVYIGDTVTCELTIVELDDRYFSRAEAVLTNQHGEKVLTGELTGFLPNREEQKLLTTIPAPPVE